MIAMSNAAVYAVCVIIFITGIIAIALIERWAG